jgi:hypothetical protein
MALEPGRWKMRLLVIIGLLLVILGIIALAVPSITFFTTEHVVQVGFLRIEASKPHTIVFNPIVGIVTLITGIVLVLLGRRPA